LSWSLNWTRLPQATSSTVTWLSAAVWSRVRPEIDDGEALGRRLHVVGHIGAGELAQLLDHPIGGQFAALGPLGLGLFDRRGDVKFCPTPPPLAEDDPRPAAPAETNAWGSSGTP
jgi:hypothetical protein